MGLVPYLSLTNVPVYSSIVSRIIFTINLPNIYQIFTKYGQMTRLDEPHQLVEILCSPP